MSVETDSVPSGRPLMLLPVGMHRSGTSALARLCGLLGAALPAGLLGPSPSNPRGHFEPGAVVRLNDELLEDLGSHWDDPVAIDWEALSSERRTEAALRITDAVRSVCPPADLVVLKDPRIARLLPLWLPALESAGYDVRPILLLRHPAEIVASLAQRDGMTRNYAYHLVATTLAEACLGLSGRPALPVLFDDLVDDWRGAADRIARRCDFVWPRVGTHADGPAIDRSLRHHTGATVDTCEFAAFEPLHRLWQALRAWAEEGGSPPPASLAESVRNAPIPARALTRELAARERRLRQQTAVVDELHRYIRAKIAPGDAVGSTSRDGPARPLGEKPVAGRGALDRPPPFGMAAGVGGGGASSDLGSSTWIAAELVPAELHAALRRKEPFSAIRLGDGEGRIMGWPDHVPTAALADIWRTWFGTARFDPDDIRQIREQLKTACLAADLVGLPRAEANLAHDFGRVSPLFHGGGYARPGVKLCSAGFHLWLERSDQYRALLSGLPVLGLIGCRNVRRHVEAAFGIRETFWIRTPPEMRYAGDDLDPSASAHWPDRFRAIVDREIPAAVVGRPAVVVLVGAGVLGKLYCAEIRRLGGIAIDVGSVMDLWSGLRTRDDPVFARPGVRDLRS